MDEYFDKKHYHSGASNTMFKKKTLKLLLGVAVTGAVIKNPTSYDLIEQNVILPLSHRLPPEVAHKCALWTIRLKIPPRNDLFKPNMLRTTVFGLHFDNPIGLAAGFDKDCEAVSGMQRLGFGFVEVGSITPLPQVGNDQPRVFRLLEDDAIINRYGFPSKGADAAAKRFAPLLPFIRIDVVQVPDEKVQKFLEAHDLEPPPPAIAPNPGSTSFQIKSKWSQTLIEKYLMPSTCKVGINLGINKTSKNPTNDYCVGVEKLGQFSDYIVINVSSPNTPGLRNLQRKNELEKMLRHISKRVEKKNKNSGDSACKALLLKISPDLTDDYLQEVIEVVMNPAFGVKGVIVSNTTVSRPDTVVNSSKNERGGLSGPPLKNLSTEMIKKVYTMTDGSVPIVGVGGVSSAEDAYEKIRAGASLVQLYTGLVYNGLGLIRRMKTDLCKLLQRDGYINVQMAVGADVPDVTNKTINDIFRNLELDFHKMMLPPLTMPPPPDLDSLQGPKSNNIDSFLPPPPSFDKIFKEVDSVSSEKVGNELDESEATQDEKDESPSEDDK